MARRVLMRDVADIRRGPAARRGIVELNGEGEAVGGIVVMRQGENARAVIRDVRERLEALRPGLPEGVEINRNLRSLGIDRPGHLHPVGKAGAGVHYRLLWSSDCFCGICALRWCC